MKKLITLFLVLFAFSLKAQVSDVVIQDTIDLYIVPNMAKAITAAKVNTCLTLLNENKLNKDSAAASSWTLTDTNITNNNLGNTIIKQPYFYPLPPYATPRAIGRVLGVETNGQIKFSYPIDLYRAAMDTLRILAEGGTPDTNQLWYKPNSDTIKTDNNVVVDSSFFMHFNNICFGYGSPTPISAGYKSIYSGLSGDTMNYNRIIWGHGIWSQDMYSGLLTGDYYANVNTTYYDTTQIPNQPSVSLSAYNQGISSSAVITPQNVTITSNDFVVNGSFTITSGINADSTLIHSNVVVDSSLRTKTLTFNQVVPVTIDLTADTALIDFRQGNMQSIDMITEDAALTIYTIIPPDFPAELTIQVLCTTTSTRINFPSRMYLPAGTRNLYWEAGTVYNFCSTDTDSFDMIYLYWDGTNLLCHFILDFKQ